MFKFALVDNNELDNGKLEEAILNFGKNNNQNFKIDKFDRGINFIEDFDNSYDAIFLDINMPIMSGLETANKIREKNSNAQIIFVTNYASLAINGYGVNAFGFIVKPITQNDIDQILTKLVKVLEETEDKSKIIIKIKSGYQTIKVSEIKYIEVNIHDIFFVCKNGTYQTRGVLKDIEKSINNPKFVKCCNCYLINLDYVDSIINDYIKINDKLLKISRTRKKEFISSYLNYYR